MTDTNHSNENDLTNDDSDDTNDQCWYYRDIVVLLRQKLLSTDIVYLLVDTCYSGSARDAFDVDAVANKSST